MLNKTDPKTDPCGTPFINADQEINDFLIFSLCQRLNT